MPDAGAEDPSGHAQSALQEVMQSLLALDGLGIESMVRDVGWRFMDAGRRLERAIQLLSLLRATVVEDRGTAADSLVLESVLTAAESIITYRRRYRSHAQLETVLDLLLLDGGNPRSLAYQLERLTEDLDVLPSPTEGRLREEQRLVLEASTALRLSDPAALVEVDQAGRRPALEAFLGARARAAPERRRCGRSHALRACRRRPSRWSGPPAPSRRSGAA